MYVLFFQDLKSGTTVVCCLLRPKERMLYTAWVGDSQAVLVKNGVAMQIVKSHKPNRPVRYVEYINQYFFPT